MSEFPAKYQNSDTDVWTAVTGAAVTEDAGASQSEDGTIQLRKED